MTYTRSRDSNSRSKRPEKLQLESHKSESDLEYLWKLGKYEFSGKDGHLGSNNYSILLILASLQILEMNYTD